MVRTRNKIVLLFTWTEDTPFIQASKVLHKLSESEQATPRVISIDSMSVGYEKGNVEDYLVSIAASEKHKIVMYKDRGENLSYLHKYDPACSTTPIDSWGHPVKDPEEMSGSERLRKQIQAEKETKNREAKELAREQRSETGKKLENFFRAFNAGIATKLKAFTSKKRVFDNRGQGKASTSKKITNDSPKSSPKPTKADLGEVKPPVVMPVENPKDHMRNAFLEFAALTIAIQDVTQTMCKNILNIYKKGDIEQLKRKLEENEGTIYNNKSSQYILGDARQNMAAYNDTCGLVYLDEQATKITGKAKYKTPENDPIVVMTRDTKVALEERILRTMRKLSKENDQDYSETFTDWETPKITWINGVPGCGKTTWIVQEFDNKRGLHSHRDH
ncbi:hypothetical protein EVAR_102476_1 [Eumeta japonica]|uniref:(+)RNA virus helicase C-terminal domain-containing protein n=1 Tax=Eumeta variegata TaxID=151549 RepID=A0A4C1ZUL6_EUMVA|nr:hypothetical protein EVAR_102476_1 [Eumeta japonica]